jgi:hypothetical protein
MYVLTLSNFQSIQGEIEFLVNRKDPASNEGLDAELM